MNDFDRAMYAWADGVKARFNNFTNSLSNKGEEFNEWQKEKSRNIKAAERKMANNIYNWGQGIKSSTQKNLNAKGRKLTPPEMEYVKMATLVSPEGDVAEVYNFNPVLERVREENLNAFRKPQLNASPDIINVTEGIGGTIAPATQEQITQNRITEAKSKIAGVLDFMLKGGQINTKAGVNLAKNLIDLYKKLK